MKQENKEAKENKDKRKFKEVTHQIGQKLIVNYPKKSKDVLKNEKDYAKLIEDITKNDLPQLNKIYDEQNKKIKELTETLQRLQAEFENYKKGVEKEKEEFLRYAKADLIVKLLPILDSFELAIKNTTDNDKFIKGVELIFAQLYALLQSEGLMPIKAIGEKFDPYKHEVLMKQESDKEEDIILEEMQKGYMLNDKVLRHSKVKVSKKSLKK